MRIVPNDAPVMELGEIRPFSFKIKTTDDVDSVVVTCANLTTGTPDVSNSIVTVDVTASKAGTHKLFVTANLASGAKGIGWVRVKVVDSSSCQTGGRDYD